MNPGDIVKWKTLNGYAEGEVMHEDDCGYIVKLRSGKYVVLSNPDKPIKRRRND